MYVHYKKPLMSLDLFEFRASSPFLNQYFLCEWLGDFKEKYICILLSWENFPDDFQFSIQYQIANFFGNKEKYSTYICYSSTELLKLDSFFSSSNIVKEAKGHIIYLKSHSNSTELSILPLFANCQERRYENCHRHIVEIASNFCKRPLRGFVSSSNSIKNVFGEMCVCKFAFFVKKYYEKYSMLYWKCWQKNWNILGKWFSITFFHSELIYRK